MFDRNLDNEEEDEENWLDGVRGKSPDALKCNSFLSQNLMVIPWLGQIQMDSKRVSQAKTQLHLLPEHHYDGLTW